MPTTDDICEAQMAFRKAITKAERARMVADARWAASKEAHDRLAAMEEQIRVSREVARIGRSEPVALSPNRRYEDDQTRRVIAGAVMVDCPFCSGRTWREMNGRHLFRGHLRIVAECTKCLARMTQISTNPPHKFMTIAVASGMKKHACGISDVNEEARREKER